jgi:osmotically-inducible protein OsmY
MQPERSHPSKSARRIFTAFCLAVPLSLVGASPVQAAGKIKPTDAEITAAVEGELSFDASVPANDIDVKTADGIVTLSGKVPTLLARNRANLVVETVKGVRAVSNAITVTPISRTDDEIHKDVEAALMSDPATNAYVIKIAVKDKVVTLTGTVESWGEKELATEVAEGVGGVKEVKSNVAVISKAERPDAEIAADVKGMLVRDAWVDGRFITAIVKNGAVILTGTVGSLAEKHRAHSDSEVIGVKSVDDTGLKIEAWAKDAMKLPRKTVLKTDPQIAQAVTNALLFDPRVVSFTPVVAVNRGVVTLTGTVDNLKAKRKAEQDARDTEGVWRVKNLLKVRTRTMPTDETVAQNVRRALVRDPELDHYKIGVTALQGVVHLNGTVDSYFEKAHADDVASRIYGVTDLRNDLVVSHPEFGNYFWPFSLYAYQPPHYAVSPANSTWPYKDDAEVKADIRDRLSWSPFVNSDQVGVSVRNGVATLNGTVEDWREYNLAKAEALQGGALMVINDLVVK